LNGNGLKALEIYYSLSTPNEQTYSIILNACSHSVLIHQAQQIFDSIPISRRNVFIYATMVNPGFFLSDKDHHFSSDRLMLCVVLRKLMKHIFFLLNMKTPIQNIHRCILHY